jgi:hypothetical protein
MATWPMLARRVASSLKRMNDRATRGFAVEVNPAI